MFIHLPPATDDLIDNDAEETRLIYNVNHCEIVETVVKFASKTLHRQEEFEDIKGVIRIRKSKNRQRLKKVQRENNDLQNIQ